MALKKVVSEFDSNTNQLPYNGTPGTYIDYTNTAFVFSETDESFDSDMVPQTNRRFFLTWPQLDDSYSPVYARFRVRNESYNAQSFWGLPKLLHTPVRYSVYKRRVVTSTPNEWSLVEVTLDNHVGGYQENWAGRVQYAVCIYHKNDRPLSTEGLAWTDNYPTDVINPYVLFMTDPDDSNFDTRPTGIVPL